MEAPASTRPDYSGSTTAWTINLAAASSQAVSGKEVDTLSAIENVLGGAAIDTITGNASANLLEGGANNDRLTGGGGNDRIQGGLGTDVAVFAGLQASYSIVTSAGSIQIVDNQPATDGDDGTDTLAGVERAEFKGGVQVALAAPIVLDLDGDGIELVDRASPARASTGTATAMRTGGWMGASDGMLVYDRDGDGTVSGSAELSFVDDRPVRAPTWTALPPSIRMATASSRPATRSGRSSWSGGTPIRTVASTRAKC
jgi:hypothetical protein